MFLSLIENYIILIILMKYLNDFVLYDFTFQNERENKHSINFGINFINESLRKFSSTIFSREIANLLNLFLRLITVLYETS